MRAGLIFCKPILLIVFGLGALSHRWLLLALRHWELLWPHLRRVLRWHLQRIPGSLLTCRNAVRGPQRLLAAAIWPLMFGVPRRIIAASILWQENKIDLQVAVCNHAVKLRFVQAQIKTIREDGIKIERGVDTKTEIVIRSQV